MSEQKNPTLEEVIRMRIVVSAPGMEAVNIRRDIEYKTGDDQPLRMDIYSPPEGKEARPAVILVHGGPIPKIGAKNLGVFVSYGEFLAASGLVAVTFDHRFLAPERIADAAQDVLDAVSYVRSNAGLMGIDPERLAIWAFSGGGLFLAAVLRERPSWLHALVAYYALLDLEQLPPGADSRISEELRQTFSAACSLGEDARTAPPLLIARAGLDYPWLNAAIDRFVQTGLSKGATLDLLNHPNGRHGFDILDDDARSKQIIMNTLAFLRDHLVT